jgi:hypothetical protein
MSQQQQQQQQGTTTKPDDTDINKNLDYLSINRARWDERAPHASDGSGREDIQSHDLTQIPARHLPRLCRRSPNLLPNLALQHPALRPPPPPLPPAQSHRPPAMPHRNRHALARPSRSFASCRLRPQPRQPRYSARSSLPSSRRRESNFRGERRLRRC